MKQVLQHLRTGLIEIADVPTPAVRAGHVLIATTRSVISAGTERSLVEFSRAGLIGKARAQPEKVQQVLTKIKTDGLLPTLEAVFSRLDEPLPLGYCCAGKIIEVGEGVRDFGVGDRVISNGPHAEVVCVPVNLVSRIPDPVDDDAAAFTVLGSIALHGIRLAEPTFGERCVVVGLGLIGLIAVQILRHHGCHVLGIDTNPERCDLARRFGCETHCVQEGSDPVTAALSFSRGRGVDAVIITASSKSDEIMRQAAAMSRQRGRIVLIGVVGLNLRRSDFYEKELAFRVSCSYGPGRYDSDYEAKGRDYPLAYVRWTEGRNFEAVLDAIAQGWVDVAPLITERIAQREADKAYERIVAGAETLGIVLTYPERATNGDRVVSIAPATATAKQAADPIVGVIGAGNFARQVLLPAIKATGVPIKMIASASGVTAVHAARKFNAEGATSEVKEILQSPDITTVFIATRHNSHAALTAAALQAGKHVFVEKPLAINADGLDLVRKAHEAHADRQLMVGFNRRFAPHTVKAKALLTGRSEPIAVTMIVNAGQIPPDNWNHDPEVGGGRIVGEGCHFIDLVMFLIGSPITTVHATMFGHQSGGAREDKMTITLSFADGSIGTVHYLANGPKSLAKERVEVFSEGRALIIDNWRSLRGYEWSGAGPMKTRQDKGHRAEVAAFIDSVRHGGAPLIPFEQLDMVTTATFAAIRSARDGETITLASQQPTT